MAETRADMRSRSSCSAARAVRASARSSSPIWSVRALSSLIWRWVSRQSWRSSSRSLRRSSSAAMGLLGFAFEVGEAAFVDFGDAGEGADVLGVLLDGGSDLVPAVVPAGLVFALDVLHEFERLGQGFVAFGESVEAF